MDSHVAVSRKPSAISLVNQEPLIYLKLQRLFSLPTILTQVMGYSIFSVEPDNLLKIRVSWVIYVLVHFVLQAVLCVIYLTVTHHCGHDFGEFGPSDRYANAIPSIVFTVGANQFRFWVVVKRRQFQRFQERLTQLTLELAAQGETDENSAVFAPLNRAVHSSRKRGIFMGVCFLLNVVAFIGGFTYIFNLFPDTSPILFFCLVVILMLVTWLEGVNYLALSIWFTCYIDWLSWAYHLLSHRETLLHSDPFFDTTAVDTLLSQLEMLDEMVEEFNFLFGSLLLFWLPTVTVTLLQHSFLLFRWAQASYVQGILVTFAVILPYPVALFDLCATSHRFTSEVDRDVQGVATHLLANLDVETTPPLKNKIMTLYQKRLIRPATLSPCHFFTLNRMTFTKIIGLIVTYLVVLVQFRSSDKNIDHLQEKEILFGRFDNSTTRQTFCGELFSNMTTEL